MPMVVIDGIRYRAEDAKRLGLAPEPETKARRPGNKARVPRNKAADTDAKAGKAESTGDTETVEED